MTTTQDNETTVSSDTETTVPQLLTAARAKGLPVEDIGLHAKMITLETADDGSSSVLLVWSSAYSGRCCILHAVPKSPSMTVTATQAVELIESLGKQL